MAQRLACLGVSPLVNWLCTPEVTCADPHTSIFRSPSLNLEPYSIFPSSISGGTPPLFTPFPPPHHSRRFPPFLSASFAFLCLYERIIRRFSLIDTYFFSYSWANRRPIFFPHENSLSSVAFPLGASLCLPNAPPYRFFFFFP